MSKHTPPNPSSPAADNWTADEFAECFDVPPPLTVRSEQDLKDYFDDPSKFEFREEEELGFGGVLVCSAGHIVNSSNRICSHCNLSQDAQLQDKSSVSPPPSSAAASRANSETDPPFVLAWQIGIDKAPQFLSQLERKKFYEEQAILFAKTCQTEGAEAFLWVLYQYLNRSGFTVHDAPRRINDLTK